MKSSLTREQDAWNALNSYFVGACLVLNYDRASLLMETYSQRKLTPADGNFIENAGSSVSLAKGLLLQRNAALDTATRGLRGTVCRC